MGRHQSRRKPVVVVEDTGRRGVVPRGSRVGVLAPVCVVSDDDKPRVTRDLALLAIEMEIKHAQRLVDRNERKLKASLRSLELRQRDLARYERDGTKPTQHWFKHHMEDFARRLRADDRRPSPRQRIEVDVAPFVPSSLGDPKSTSWVKALLARGTPKKGPAS